MGGQSTSTLLLIQYSVRNVLSVTVDDPLLCLVYEFNFIVGMDIEDQTVWIGFGTTRGKDVLEQIHHE